MKKNKKYLIIFFVLIGVALVSYGLIIFKKAVKKVESSSTIVDSIPKEYKTLFIHNDSSFSKIETHIINKSQRSPVSNFLYNDMYYITVAKIKTIKYLDTLPSIKLGLKETEESYYGLFYGFDFYYGEFNYRSTPLTGSDIYLALHGDSIKPTTKTDRSIGYCLKMNKVSLSYKENGAVDLYMTDPNSETSPKSILLFLNNHKNLYLIYIIDQNHKKNIDPKVINQIISNN